MDLIYVTYNSEKWIEQCFSSIEQSNINLQEINIIVVDNASNDSTVDKLKNASKRLQSKVGKFEIILNSLNEGFGKANNIGFHKSNSEIVCFLNIDTVLLKDSLTLLRNELIISDSETAVWEFRQLPYEHPKHYNILTGETTWVSGAAFAVRRSVYAKAQGFDQNIFMYAEDVDLSWRIRKMGYKLKYLPNVSIIHHSYESGVRLKHNQYVYGVINNLFLRYRFGTIKNILVGHIIFWRIILKRQEIAGAKKLLLLKYLNHFIKVKDFYSRGVYKKKSTNFKPKFIGFDYETSRKGAFYKCILPQNKPLVSIIVRTCGRPNVLRETLISLRKQTYDNLEIIVIEDGDNLSQNFIEEEFNDININYYSTQKKVGRSRAGNIGMEKASGKYLNFLDDDDLFYADHVEILVQALENSTERAAYSIGEETAIVIHSLDPYEYEIMSMQTVHEQHFDKVMLCHHNYIPIQCIMFEKALFMEAGGLDENVDALEDWDLWVRYAQYTDFIFVQKTTSVYRVPFNKSINNIRQKALDEALIIMREKHKCYQVTTSANLLAILYDKMISDNR